MQSYPPSSSAKQTNSSLNIQRLEKMTWEPKPLLKSVQYQIRIEKVMTWLLLKILNL